MDLLIGTTNRGKLREYQALLADAPIRCLSLTDVGLAALDVDEPHDTYEGNAGEKAVVYARASGLVALADDTGLEVDALGGRPGVYSARYAGHGATDRDRYLKLLDELKDIPDAQRTARFVCVVAIAHPTTREVVTARGVVEGKIAQQPGEGSAGFGYDAVFIADGFDVCFSALPLEVKNRISHRGNAARGILPALVKMAG